MKARANLSLGLCLELAEDRDRAVEYYSKVVAARAFDEDAAASRHARQLLEAPMGPLDVLLLRADQAFQSSRPDSASVLYMSAVESAAATPAQRGAALYGLGRSSHETGHLEEALGWYDRAISTPGDARAKWAPWSLFHTAEIRESMGQTGTAISILDRLLAYPDAYDFRPTLENRARIWREALLSR